MKIPPATTDQPTMTALVLEEFGGQLVERRVARPRPAAGEVLVQVVASGVNPLDTKITAGSAAHAQVALPAILGIDLAGVVAEVGTGVTDFVVGDEVYGMTGGIGEIPGSLAEYAAVDARLLAMKPTSLSFAGAAALPLSTITAWEGLVDRANVGPGDVVLVHGGAGGVGHIAVQIAIAHGATVFATGSGDSLDVISRLGATPIDYRANPVPDYVATATGGAGFDIVFDTVGGATLDQSFAQVRPHTGHVVSILGWGVHSLAPLSFRSATYSGVFTLLPILTGAGREHHGEILRRAAALVDGGQLSPLRANGHYDLSLVSAAHEAVGSGAAKGKVVIEITEPATRSAR